MKASVLVSLICVALIAVPNLRADDPAHEEHPKVSPEQAILWLQEGNARFLAGKVSHPHEELAQAKETAQKGQHPFATILSCSDSRVPLDVIFDRGIGDIFSIRVAGNVNGEAQAGSIEYGVEHCGTRLCVVLGHTQCGAITAACTGGGHEGNIKRLMYQIEPAVKRTEKATGKKGKEIIEECCRENIFCQIDSLLRSSEILREAVEKKELMIVGAVYHIETGNVEFLGQHPQQAELLKEPVRAVAP